MVMMWMQCCVLVPGASQIGAPSHQDGACDGDDRERAEAVPGVEGRARPCGPGENGPPEVYLRRVEACMGC